MFIKHSLIETNQSIYCSDGTFPTWQVETNQFHPIEGIPRSRTAPGSRDENLKAKLLGGGGRVKGGTEA